MAIFTQHLNPVTGQNEWNLQTEDYDYKQEVARSSYADMLHDQERNDMYYEAIRRCVSLLRKQNKEIHVLDIGTGTGLLSMMALSCGVDSVTACEAFIPMVDCAKKIFEINGFSDKVNLIGKRSTELECGEGKEMPRRANLLVTEVFDTELIGEGAIETFSHAKEHLLTPDALIVPSEATVYAQVISSDLVKMWNKNSPIFLSPDSSPGSEMPRELLTIPEIFTNCPGAVAVHDIQLSEFPPSGFTSLSKPIRAFEFDWSGRKIPLNKEETTHRTFEALTTARADGVFMWWDLKMDPEGEIVLSCAPIWEHPKTKENPLTKVQELPWRDHWMQAVYYFPKPLEIKESESVTLISSHDEYSLWFSLSREPSEPATSRPICECGLHATVSRTRMGQMSDPRRASLYVRMLERHVTAETVSLFLGDCCLMGIVAAKLGARHVYIHQTSGVAKRILNDFIVANKVEGKVSVLSSHLSDTRLENLVGRISLVFSEPYFDTSMLPWDSLQLLYRLRASSHLLEREAVILPNQLTIRCLPVQFRDLWKIRSSLNICSGFKLQPFDEMIEKASDEADERVEPQPLWEYPAVPTGFPISLLTLPLSTLSLRKPVSLSCHLPLEHPNQVNGIAMWAEWQFGPEDCLTTGPTQDVSPGSQVVWDMYTRQGVYLFNESQKHLVEHGGHVICTTTFDPADGLMNFQFDVKES